MNRTWKEMKTAIPGHREVFCKVATTTDGTLAATQTQYGLKLTKTASETGRYTCQLVDHLGNAETAVALVDVNVNLIVADDTALTDAKGIWQGIVRDDDIATAGTVKIQLTDADSGADAEAQDGAVLCVKLTLADSSTQ